MSKAVLTHPSWSQIEKGAYVLSMQLAQKFVIPHPCGPTIIVGLARGGLVPAIIMSHILGMQMFSVSYSSKRGKGEYKLYDNILPVFPESWNLVFVDDLTDTGYTMKEISDTYEDRGHVVRTATLFHKEGAAITPDFVWQTIPSDAPWIVFPWEV